MKKYMKILVAFCFVFFIGLTVNQTTSKAGCYFPKYVTCYKHVGNANATGVRGTYKVWTYTGNIDDAIDIINSDSGTAKRTLYYDGAASNGQTNEIEKQLFINKSMEIVGISGLSWVHQSQSSGGTWYSTDGKANSTNRLSNAYVGVTNITEPTGQFSGLPNFLMKGTKRITKFLPNLFGSSESKPSKYLNEDKLEKDSFFYKNVFGISMVIKKPVTIRNIKFSGMCGTYNNPCSLVTVVNGGNLIMENVWLADNNWYTYEGKNASDWSSVSSEQPDGIGNPGGGLTVFGSNAKCTLGDVKISNCHGYFTGGGIHVGGSGELNNADNSVLEIVNCSASSGGGIGIVTGGVVDLGASGSTSKVLIYDNYLDKDAYYARGADTVGYSSGNIHIGGDSRCRIGCTSSDYQIYNGGKESAYMYARAGTPDVGNIVCKGQLSTDHCTSIYDGLGQAASDVYVTSSGTWTYGRNGTTTEIGNADGGSSIMVGRSPFDDFCGKTNTTIRTSVLNGGGTIKGADTNSKLNINASTDGNFDVSWMLLYNRSNGTLDYRGSMYSDDSLYSDDLKSIATNSGATSTIRTSYISSSAGPVYNIAGTVTLEDTNTFSSGLTTNAGAKTYVNGISLNCQDSYLANWGYTQIGDNVSYPKIQNTIIHNYGDGTTFPNEKGQGNSYQSYYNGKSKGCLVFNNGSSSGSSLTLFGGYVRFEETGGMNETTSSSNPLSCITVNAGSLHLDGEDITLKPHVKAIGEQANVHVSDTGDGYSGKIYVQDGRTELDNKGKVNIIYSQGIIDVDGRSVEVSTIENCGEGKVHHRNGKVLRVYNGRYSNVTDTNGPSEKSKYYHIGGDISPIEGNSSSVFVNYGKYYGADANCEKVKGSVCEAKVLSSITNNGTMTLGSNRSSGTNLQIGDSEIRKMVTNNGTINNLNGKVYASSITNHASATILNQTYDETQNKMCRIDASQKIVNLGTLKAYAGTVKTADFENQGKAILRGTFFDGTVTKNTGNFHVLNPLLPEQTTTIQNVIDNEGTLTIDNEVTDATNDLTFNLDKISGTGTVKINTSAVEEASAMHRAIDLTIENTTPIESENEKSSSYYKPMLYWETKGNLELGPGVTVPKGIKNNHTLKITSGTAVDAAVKLSRTLPTKVKSIENNGTLTSESQSKILLTGENADDSFYTNANKTTTINGAIVSDNDTVQIVNLSGAKTRLKKSGLTGGEIESGYKGRIINNGGSVVLGVKESTAEEFRVNNKNGDEASINNVSGTTTIEHGGVSEESAEDAIEVKTGQVLLNDGSAEMIHGKKIKVHIDDTNGTWKDGKAAILDNSTATHYVLNLSKNANDTLVNNNKVPFSKISNEERLKNWSKYISASDNKVRIERVNDNATDKRYTLATNKERKTLPEDATVYLTMRDNTPPEIKFPGSKDKYVEVDCRAGSHSTEYLPLKVSDDVTGVATVKVEVLNEDSGEKRSETFTYANELEPTIPEETEILSLHNDEKKETFGNLQIKVTATDASGNTDTVTKEVMAGRINIVIEDKFEDSQTQSGNPYCYWNFIKVSEDVYKENIGPWLAGDQKWLSVTLEGFFDKVTFGYENTQNLLDMKNYKNNPNSFTVEKTSYKTINGKKNGERIALTVPRKARYKELNFVGTITTEKKGKNVTDKKVFTYELETLKNVSIENSIERRILQQNTQLPDGRWTDGFTIFPNQ